MLKVRKKKRRGGRKGLAVTLAGILLILAGGTTVHLLNREATEPLPERTESGGVILGEERGSLTRLEIHVRGREPWSAIRNGEGNLVPENDPGWTLDETLGERIEDALENLLYEDILTENPNDYRDRLDEFGLAEPTLTAKAAYADGKTVSFRIGDASGLEDADWRFMLVDGDDHLYAVAGSLLEDLQMERELLHPVVEPEIQPSRLDRITLRNGEAEVIAEWHLEGNVTDTDAAENWILETGEIRYPADAEQISSLKKNAGNLRPGLYIAEATAENLGEYGLEKPESTIELHLAAGTTGYVSESGVYDLTEREEETIRFAIGKTRNEMTDYALYDGVIYTMNHFTVAALTETDPRSTLSRYPVTVPPESLSGMTITRADGTKDEYRLTYVNQPSETEGEPDKATVICTRNGTNYSYETFAAAYERMRVVTVSGELPAGWQKQESTTEYTFQTLSGAIHSVELSPFDALHDAVTVDGYTLFYLIRDGMPGWISE